MGSFSPSVHRASLHACLAASPTAYIKKHSSSSCKGTVAAVLNPIGRASVGYEVQERLRTHRYSSINQSSGIM